MLEGSKDRLAIPNSVQMYLCMQLSQTHWSFWPQQQISYCGRRYTRNGGVCKMGANPVIKRLMADRPTRLLGIFHPSVNKRIKHSDGCFRISITGRKSILPFRIILQDSSSDCWKIFAVAFTIVLLPRSS
jgi:hypothetical protein